VKYFLYILECVNGSYYTGYTNDIERRYQEHCEGSSKCKYTRSYPPRRIAACWEMDCSLSEALKLECYVKGLSKQQKYALVAAPKNLFDRPGVVGLREFSAYEQG
jgi:putative endonuclease